MEHSEESEVEAAVADFLVEETGNKCRAVFLPDGVRLDPAKGDGLLSKLHEPS